MGSNTPFSSKEMHYVFRVLAPASCREPTLFTDVAKNTLRIALFPMFKKDEDDSRYASANAVQMLKSLPAKPGPVPQLEGPMRLVICDLLNALTVKSVQPVPENNTNQPENIEQVSNSENQTLLRDNSSVNLLQQDDDTGIAGLDVNGETSESSVNGRERNRLCKDCVKDNKVGDTVKKSTLLLPKSIICRLLAELVRSYSGCAKLIAEYTYPAGQSELITEDCTALAFLLDNVLPQCQTVGDKDASALARVLIAALASCNHSPEAQTALVNEVKAALNRSLTLPESSEKHARIQALTGLVGTMIESCPSSSQNQLASSTFRNQQNSMNNIVRVLLRKGLVTDLARIPHCLDLSSPHMPATINSALKPLETLSRLVNLPTTQIGNRSSNRGKSSTAVIENQEQAPEAMEEDTTTTQTTSAVIGNIEVSTSEATTTYGETAVDDSAENTDSEVPDVTIAPEDVVVIPSSQSQHISETDDLDGIMDELLERHSHPDDQILGEVIIAGTNERNQSGEHEELVISVETDMDDHHDSQMISQHESEFEEDHTQGEDDHQQSSDSDSNSESGHSRSEDEAEQDDDQEDGDDDAEDEDEEEDEESHFDLNNGLQDIEEALFGMQDRDDSLFFQLEEVFPTSGTSSIVFGGSDGFRTFQIPVVTDDNTNSAENSAPSIPPAPGNVTPTHPLLVRHGDPQGAVASRLHRSNRQRGYRPALGNQTWHMYTSSGRHPNPPAILQRLLGPNTAQDILQLTSTFSSHPTSGQARVFFANSDLRILATDEDVFEIQDQNTPVSGGPSNTLASIPSALARWTEESRVLDGDSVHECVTGLKPSIISVLEKYRDEELEERLEKRKKLQEEEEIKNQQKEEKEKTEFSQIQENIAPSNADNQETRENNTEETTLPSSSVIGPTAMEVSENDINKMNFINDLVLFLAPSIPPAPGNVTPTHPLLVRHGDPQGAVASRLHRSNRQRGYRPALGNQTWHMYTSSGRHPNPPAILQRLLGPNTAQDILQLTSTFSSHPTSGQARVFFANSDLRILATDEDVFEIQDQNTPVSGGPSNTLASIPSALARWTEESRVLDGDSVHECVTGLKPSIISVLEKYRDEELEERLEKRKKLQEEEEIKNQQKEEKEKTEFSQIQENIAPSNADNQETRENNTEETTLPSSSVIGPTAMEITESGQAIATDTDQTNAISGMNNVLPATPSTTTTTVTTTAAVTTTTTTTTPAVVAGTTPVGTSLNTERLAASIVEQVLGPALAITSTPNPSMASTAPAVMPTLTTSSISTVVSEAINFMMGVTTANHGMTLSTSVTPFTGRWQDGTFTSSSALGIPVPSSVQQDSLGNSAVPSPMDTSEPTFVASLASETNEIACTSEAPISENQDTVGASTEQDDALHMDAELANIEREGQIPVFPGGGNEESTDQSSLPQIENSMIEQSENRQTCAAEALIDAIINRATNENMGTPSSVLTESDFSNILGDVEIPEGVDPSFLAALPENIRQEVIAEQLRLQRLRQRAQAANSQATTEGGNFTEVNPEFLAALPPNIQEEVLAQQRAEQQRLAAQNSNPDTPVDPAGFIQTLPPALRQQVLADMDDSLLALLPPDLAAEAHALRRELEARHRQMQERFLSSHAGTALSRILRSAAGRMGTRYTIHTVPQRGQWTWNTLSRGAGSSTAGTGGIQSGSLPSSLRLRGRQMLDHEALSCLLVLLFVDEPKLNTGRLHRVLRNLCYHAPTRQWVIKALLSVLERTKDSRLQENNHDHFSETYHRAKKSVVKTFSHTSENIGPSSHRLESASRSSQPSWLSISLDAALGCRTNVFQIHRHGHSAGPKKPSDKHSPSVTTGICQPIVTIHPQASPIVFRHVLDTLISLAKSFPIHFLPEKAKEEKYGKDVIAQDNRASKTTVPITAKSDSKQVLSTSSKTEACGSLSRQDTDFWDVLIKLDSLSTSRKGKSIARTHSTTTMIGSNSNANIDDDTKYQSFEASPMAQLISMLSHPVVKRSSLLTDRLLRLLALISLALPDQDSQNYTQSTNQLLSVNATANLRNGTNSLISRAMEVPSCGRDDSHPVAEEKTAASEDDKVPSKESISHVQLGEEEEKEDIIIKQHLKLAVEVLTSKTCSEEGLEDATALLLRLSRSCARTRKSVLHLLLEGARELGQVVCLHIRALIEELRNLNARLAVERIATNELEEKENEAEAKLIKGMIQDRFTHTTVIITAPTKVKGSGSRELQLPSMAALTSKTSSQAFFLRILKVIIQLREATRLAQQRARQASVSSDVLQQSVLTSQNLPETQLSVLQETIASNENEGSNEGNQQATPMEIDTVTPSSQNSKKEPVEEEPCLPPLSFQLSLEELWETLSECLVELAETPDHHAVLVLQPAVEAFFLVHASSSEKESNKRKEYRQESRENQLAHIHQDIAPLSPLPATSEAATIAETSNIVFSRENSLATISTALPADTQKFLKFAETHRTVLNQILRQSTTPLADGPFSVLVDHTRVLDFDVKRRYFRQELERMDEGARREDLAVHVRREHVFEDSFRELHRRSPEEWKNRFYIVFEGEEGQDAGGLLREWYTIISREIFNPMYALFTISPGDRVTYMINQSSHCNSNHLSYFKFVGRVIAKAVYDNKLLECYFTRSFYKHILGKLVKYTDMESEDYSFYQGLVFLLEHDVKEIGYELTFSVEVQEFGVTEIRDLKPNGQNVMVTEENKQEYVRLVCQEKMTGAIRKQLNAFLEGFYEIIPKRLIAIFNEQELELLISGLPNVDIDDLKANTEYHKYQPTSLQIQWFWRALRSFDQADRAKFLQFVTGTSKVPLQGFSALEGMNGIQKFQIHRDDRSTDRLPSAHTCFNQLDLPAYETYDKLRSMLLKAIQECSEGFGFA
ncbi:E3 ubiquitin-protein ligase HUWE1-like [Centruroides sculpturatus]|uniref:E3 ubiquitin-protein ligase HUWE1-like n=1 Tax=Centruroides sculpturatus TaxID=218467 RepID=UPI000C6D32AC|nr:E3 ubiquitin-protein ligase HUWE1-like [Centruroides sculpturatus]